MAILILLSLFLASPISIPIWEHSPLPYLVQFPWRFLSLTAFSLAVLSSRLPQKATVVITAIIIIFALPYLKTHRTFYSENYYNTNDDSTTVKNEYMPKWVRVDPTSHSVVQQTVYFPGVKVIVNRGEIEPRVDDNGIVKTPGKIVFRETPLRLFADFLSVIGVIICLLSLVRKIKFLRSSGS